MINGSNLFIHKKVLALYLGVKVLQRLTKRSAEYLSKIRPISLEGFEPSDDSMLLGYQVSHLDRHRTADCQVLHDL